MLFVPLALAAQPPGRFLPEVLGAADGLATAMVYGVTVGPDARVLVATERGVSRFDGVSFSDVPFLGGTGGNGEAAGCYAVATLGQRVWAQCADGLYRLDEAGLQRIAAMVTPGVRAGLAVGPDGAVWAANPAGVWVVHGDVAERVIAPDAVTPRAVHVDGDGAWIGAAEGLFRWKDGALTAVDPRPVRAFLDDPDGLLVGTEQGLIRIDGPPPRIGPCYVTALARAPDGRALAACGGGAWLQDRDGTWERFGPEDGLPGAVVRGLAASADGTLWLAVWKRGLVRLSETGVRLWAGDALGVEPIADLTVEDGRLFVAGWDGAWELGPDLVPARLPHPQEEDRDFASVERTGEGQLVVATADSIWTLGQAWTRGSDHEPLWDLVRDQQGRIWASDHEDAWTSDGTLRVPLPHDGTEAVFSSSRTGTLLLVGASRLWEMVGDRFVARASTPPACEGAEIHDLPHERWLVCGDGAYLQDGDRWSRAEGLLPGEELRAGAHLGDQLWVSTSAGRLLRLRPDPLVLDRAHGLPRVSFLSTRGLALYQGWIVAAAAEGVLWVDPARLARPRPAPQARIVSVESHGDVVADISRLGPDDTFLRVRLGLDGVVDPARTRYRFRLDAGEWSDPVADAVLQLPGLPAGAHRLDAAAAAAGSDWGEPASLEFTIPRRWWQRADVRLGASLFAAALAWAFWQERHRRALAQLAHAREMESVRQTFGRFVTPEVAEEALAGRLSTQGEARDVTVLFADLRGFTPLTASLPPQRLVELLNAWLTEMVAAIEAEGGVVNKFIGDAVVAIFGAPRAQPDHAERAVRAARRMAAATRAVAERHGQALRAGVGVNSGTVIAGPVGAASRMEYTVIGEVVNVAARVEALTRTLDVDVLVADDTVARLGSHGLRDRGTHALKGVPTPVRVWEA